MDLKDGFIGISSQFLVHCWGFVVVILLHLKVQATMWRHLIRMTQDFTGLPPLINVEPTWLSNPRHLNVLFKGNWVSLNVRIFPSPPILQSLLSFLHLFELTIWYIPHLLKIIEKNWTFIDPLFPSQFYFSKSVYHGQLHVLSAHGIIQ